jgi:hypothetical protein
MFKEIALEPPATAFRFPHWDLGTTTAKLPDDRYGGSWVYMTRIRTPKSTSPLKVVKVRALGTQGEKLLLKQPARS